MNKIHILSTLILVMNTDLFAQDNKEKRVDLIETSSGWLPRYTAEKLFIISLSPSMWESVLAAPSQPRGHDSFKRLAQSLVDFSDKAGYTSPNEKCGFNVQSDKAKEWQPTCKQQIDGLASKLTFTYDAASIAKIRLRSTSRWAI